MRQSDEIRRWAHCLRPRRGRGRIGGIAGTIAALGVASVAGASTVAPVAPAASGGQPVRRLQTPPVAAAPKPSIALGRQVFASRHCFYCHRIGRTPHSAQLRRLVGAPSPFGGRGGHVGAALDSESVRKRAREFLLAHFRNPATASPFPEMPPIRMTLVELQSLSLYIESLRPGAPAPALVLPADAPSREPRAASPSAAEGKALYRAATCRNCHAIGGQGASVGPALDSVGNSGRKLEWLVALFRDPDAVAPGGYMPAVQGTDRQLRSLALYLLSLRTRVKPTAVLGRKVYVQRNCGYCHGDTGKGTLLGPALAGIKGRTRNDVWVLEHFRDPSGVTPGSVMPRSAAADWEWQALLEYLKKLMGGRLGRAIAGDR